ncbi:MAG: sialate O-acetylesterase [Planctomycetes bacterium]|nr:sialate O-acetylesterase [Planctomycetota bacterium]
MHAIAVIVPLLVALTACASAPRTVKVFVLAGQSNMEGPAVADLDPAWNRADYNDGKGTLARLAAGDQTGYAHLIDANGGWAKRDDVFVHYRLEDGVLRCGPLGVGFSPHGPHHFGPELQCGHELGDAFEEPVLLVKTAWGGKSLYRDFRPPSAGGVVGPYYNKLVEQVRDACANLARDLPGLAGARVELAGLVWYQGWNDGCEPRVAVPEYQANLAHLIRDLRREFDAPALPVVIGELTGPWVTAEGEWAALRAAQAAAAALPEWRGSVVFVPTHEFVRKAEDSPHPGHGHHEFGNAETYVLVGRALGAAMVALVSGR